MFSRIFAAILLCFLCGVHSQDWRNGRATFYGDKPWLWNIHEGSCGYGYLDVDRGTGWDIAAMADVHADYAGGAACGSCYEVRCSPKIFQDNYGESIDRRGSCLDPSRSVIVTITDNCPCHYEDNFYSNKRWCCGDLDHFDLSMVAFDKLSHRRWGVIGIEYRPVACPSRPPYLRRGDYLPWMYRDESQVIAFSSEMGK